MAADRPTPILVEQAPRKLPDDARAFAVEHAPWTCVRGSKLVDELFRERRISSVEWEVLRDAIWPKHPAPGKPVLDIGNQPDPSSLQQGT